MQYEHITHTFDPVFDSNSEILILGTFPSVKSRENNFQYGHVHNRFWRVTAAVFGVQTPVSVEDKKKFLLENHIAVWDVIKTCDITNSADSTIKSVIPNDLSVILESCVIKQIYANGKTAEKLYNQYIKKKIKRDIIALPSTSPANAAFSEKKLIEKWKIIRGE